MYIPWFLFHVEPSVSVMLFQDFQENEGDLRRALDTVKSPKGVQGLRSAALAKL
jgi:hypothetical protein